MKLEAILAFSSLCVAISYGAGDNKCCVNQPKPIIKVEKTGVQTRYRQATASSRYSTKCGTFGWRRCTRYRGYTVAQSYSYDIYQKKSYPQPCQKYACCHGYTMVKNLCYANDELPKAIGNIADIKDAVSGVGDVGAGDVIGAIHDVLG